MSTNRGIKIRICGRDLPADKRAIIALTYLEGIGASRATEICKHMKINSLSRLKDLDKEQLREIEKYIEDREHMGWVVENDLKRIISANIERKIANGSRAGRRHLMGLPLHGRTRSNAKTARRRRGKI